MEEKELNQVIYPYGMIEDFAKMVASKESRSILMDMLELYSNEYSEPNAVPLVKEIIRVADEMNEYMENRPQNLLDMPFNEVDKWEEDNKAVVFFQDLLGIGFQPVTGVKEDGMEIEPPYGILISIHEESETTNMYLESVQALTLRDWLNNYLSDKS